MTPSEITWEGASKPQPSEKYKIEQGIAGSCATCGAEMAGKGVTIASIESSTFSNHADFFKYGAKRHVCMACAWLYGAGKGRPGNFIATPLSYEEAVISLDSVVKDKRPWLSILSDIAAMPSNTPVTGVMTTDVKPRLWPRCHTKTVGAFGLYVHCPDYDVSAHIDFDLAQCLAFTDAMIPILSDGYAKASLWHGLLRDYKRASKDMRLTIARENTLREMRQSPAFLPALLVSGVKKGEALHHEPTPIARKPEPAPAASYPHHQNQLDLF
jgi:hypothetical protein